MRSRTSRGSGPGGLRLAGLRGIVFSMSVGRLVSLAIMSIVPASPSDSGVLLLCWQGREIDMERSVGTGGPRRRNCPEADAATAAGLRELERLRRQIETLLADGYAGTEGD